MNVLSLFAGIGGFDLGLERAGMNVVAQCERDPWCQQVLSKHWPNVPIYDDVTTLTAEKMKNEGVESIDLICGGFPCQPFSVAGNRNGTKDDRHLWPEMLRIIEETRPAWVIGENVAGIISMEQFAMLSKMEGQANRVPGAYDDFEAVYLRKADMLLNGIIEDLEKIGYSVQSFVIPACAVDAKHRRDRIWIVANNQGGHDRQCHTQQDKGQKQQSGISSGQNTMAHTNSDNVQGLKPRSTYTKKRQGQDKRPARSQDASSRRLWTAEPRVGRVADGVPRRVDRLKGLGNAVVPQIPEIIGRMIMEVSA